MSRLKTPKQKKLASLALDRRNVYGGNDKASRKGIPRSKQMSHQSLRRAAKRPLLKTELLADEDSANRVEFDVKSALAQSKRKSFKKRPDAPLGAVLKEKAEPYVPIWQGADRLGVYREIYDPKKRKIDRS
ncbi:MAG TPA: hypothetical protein VL986_01500 [Terracidiphilus sp.]|nr:hypothetical protein [Terracidiphilus sp.]